MADWTLLLIIKHWRLSTSQGPHDYCLATPDEGTGEGGPGLAVGGTAKAERSVRHTTIFNQ
ncbi:hypothetical protein CFAM422_008546 [Trichoderma lentiforme]|uniref:Uncharacterized protein n=1 Tax=Trichoderma lentiforme TaxID=1567552 RepID=A0A9P5CBI5_9HYPO|nr:hypothetical protein CFAM422_008546 [Trichoderma lentiforme]